MIGIAIGRIGLDHGDQGRAEEQDPTKTFYTNEFLERGKYFTFNHHGLLGRSDAIGAENTNIL